MNKNAAEISWWMGLYVIFEPHLKRVTLKPSQTTGNIRLLLMEHTEPGPAEYARLQPAHFLVARTEIGHMQPAYSELARMKLVHIEFARMQPAQEADHHTANIGDLLVD
jgi:hypothetical protein